MSEAYVPFGVKNGVLRAFRYQNTPDRCRVQMNGAVFMSKVRN